MRRQSPDLTDQDLERLARLGGEADQIAEAAGIDVAQVRRRLEEPHLGGPPDQRRVGLGSAVSC